MPQPTLTMRRRVPLLAALALTASAPSLALSPRPAVAAPEADLWSRWLVHDPASTRTIDHSSWGEILQRYLENGRDGVNRVRYAALKTERRPLLQDYLSQLEAVDPDRLARAEQLAFWINLYNAQTVALVVEHFPVESIRDIAISPGLFSIGPWGRKLVTVAGEQLSLDDIEHRILRPIMRDPRIHYAVNCAAIGCPNLRPEPFNGASLETMLQAAARDYVNDPRGVALLPRRFGSDRLTVSRIYDWFVADFGGDEAGVLAHLRRHAENETASLLSGVERIEAYRYDWALNGNDG